jgi:hypothetical protein
MATGGFHVYAYLSAEPKKLEPRKTNGGDASGGLFSADTPATTDKSVIGNDLKIIGRGLKIIGRGVPQVDGEIDCPTSRLN